MHREVVAKNGLQRNQGLQDYVNKIGQELAAVSERPDLDFTFTVLDDDTVNAFALPGGYVYVTRGLLRAPEFRSGAGRCSRSRDWTCDGASRRIA